MKKFIFQSLFILIAAVGLSSCGNAAAEKKAQEEKEALALDSLANDLEKAQKEVEAKSEDLEKALEELKDIVPTKK